MTLEACGIFLVMVAAGYVLIKQNSDVKAPPPVEQPSPTPPPPPSKEPFEGSWVFDIVPPDSARWGDGIHPDEKAGKAASRGDYANGLIYRLGGSGSFSRTASGLLYGKAEIYGHECNIAIPVPINGGAVGFESDGAYFEFHFAGSMLSGKACEPHDCGNKYGYVVGRKI